MGICDYERCDSGTCICPYCKQEQHYTGDPLDDDETTEIECDNCGKIYTIMSLVTYEHKCYKQEDLE